MVRTYHWWLLHSHDTQPNTVHVTYPSAVHVTYPSAVHITYPSAIHMLTHPNAVHMITYPSAVHMITHLSTVHITYPSTVHMVPYPSAVHMITYPSAVSAVNTEFLDGQATGKRAGRVGLVIFIAKVHIFHIQLQQEDNKYNIIYTHQNLLLFFFLFLPSTLLWGVYSYNMHLTQ